MSIFAWLDFATMCSDEDLILAIKKQMKITGITQAELAKLWKISPSYLSDILKGNRKLPERIAAIGGYKRIKGWKK